MFDCLPIYPQKQTMDRKTVCVNENKECRCDQFNLNKYYMQVNTKQKKNSIIHTSETNDMQ